MVDRTPLVVIVGPTGIGKTALAIRLAQTLDGEIVSADSRQIYRGLDIGTAKPTPKEQASVPHHLIDIVDPDQAFSLIEFQERAYAAIDDITARERLPFLVGGSGQYVRAVIEGWVIPRVPPDAELRDRLNAEAERDGRQALYDRLLALDPDAAGLIDARNLRRVVRALEVCLKTGRPFSQQRGKQPPPYAILQFGLTLERKTLYRRVDARIEAMIEAGLVEEVGGLLAQGYGWELPALSSLGYLQLKGYVQGTLSLDEAVALIKKDTRRFIRQQSNWFRPSDARIHWLDADGDPYPTALDMIRETLNF